MVFQPFIIAAPITHPSGPVFHRAFLLVEGGGVVMEVHVSDVQVNVVALGNGRFFLLGWGAKNGPGFEFLRCF